LTRGDSDAHAKDKFFSGQSIDAFDSVLNGKCSVHSAGHVIAVLNGDIEKCHGGIAQQAIHDAIMLNDSSGSDLKKLFRDWSQFFYA
jgi:hypothetical protein